MIDGLPSLTPGEPTKLREELFVMAAADDNGELHGLHIMHAGLAIPMIGARTYIAQSIEKARKAMGANSHRLRIIKYTQGEDVTAGFEAGGN